MNRQSERQDRAGVDSSLSASVGQVDACAAAPRSVHALIEAHFLSAQPFAPIPFSRKMVLFVGSNGGRVSWVVIASPIETCKLYGLAPYAYLAERLPCTIVRTLIHRIIRTIWNAQARPRLSFDPATFRNFTCQSLETQYMSKDVKAVGGQRDLARSGLLTAEWSVVLESARAKDAN